VLCCRADGRGRLGTGWRGYCCVVERMDGEDLGQGGEVNAELYQEYFLWVKAAGAQD